jgi:hypothetical protein
METSYTCQFCGKDTSEVEYDYLSGTDHLSCTLQSEFKNNPIEKCVICGEPTQYRFNDHIDYRFNYVEGAGQLCVKCGDKGHNEISDPYEIEPLGTSNPSHMLILVDETTIVYTPNDAELGAKVRKIYWDLKQEQNGK